MTPNASVERTCTGMALQALISLWARRISPARPAHLIRLGRSNPEVRVRWFSSLFLVISVVVGCADDRTTRLRSEDGKTSLFYQCAKFQAKAESMAEVTVLFKYGARIQDELLTAGQNVSAFEFGKLVQNDMRALERYIVQYQCDRGR